MVDARLYIVQTGCQWRYLPESFGPWTRVWSQFRRWSRNGTWARALTVLHAAAREADGRAAVTPSMLVIDTHLARGASNGGATFHDRGGPYGRTKGAKRIVAVDVTGRLELVLVDRGVTSAAARTLGRHHGLELRRVGWDDKQPVFRPIRHAWRVRWPTVALAGPAGWRSRSRTPRAQLPAGSKSPASRPPSAICHGCALTDKCLPSLRERRRPGDQAECCG